MSKINLGIIGIVAVVTGWHAVNYFVGLRNLGYADYAIVTMRRLIVDEDKFAESHPSTGYTCNLADIARDPILARGKRNGYFFEIHGCQKDERAPNKSFVLIARSERPNRAAFCATESGVLKVDYDDSIGNCLKTGEPF